MPHSRRDLLRLTVGALPAAHLLTRPRSLFAASKPDSRIAGVQIGLIAPYAFRGTAGSAEEILESLVKLGLSGVELQNTHQQCFGFAEERRRALDARAARSRPPHSGRRGRPGPRGCGPGASPPPWRSSLSSARCTRTQA